MSSTPRLATITAMMLLIGSLVSCGPAGETEKQTDLFEPHPRDTGEVGTPEGIPAGAKPGSEFSWVDDDLEVVFHTLEESRATPGTWDEYDKQVHAPFEDRWALSIGVATYFDRDSRLERFGDALGRERGLFYGIELPVDQERLHMFECSGDAVRAKYRIGDVLVLCKGFRGMALHIRHYASVPATAPSHIPRVAPVWRLWWREIFSHSEEAWQQHSIEPFMDITLFVYDSRGRRGAAIWRKLGISRSRPACLGCDPPQGPEDWAYSGPGLLVPLEFCTGEVHFTYQCWK